MMVQSAKNIAIGLMLMPFVLSLVQAAAATKETVVASDGSSVPLISTTKDSVLLTNANKNETAAQEQSPPPVCSLYMARSTIPDAGLGIFTGVNLERGKTITWADIAEEDAWFQDLLIPIMDGYKTIPYRGQQRFLSWLGYVWPARPDVFYPSYTDKTFPQISRAHFGTPEGLSGADAGLLYITYSKDGQDAFLVSSFAPGMGSLLNSHEEFANVNLREGAPMASTLPQNTAATVIDLTHQSDFSPLAPGSGFIAQTKIEAGSELLIYYGPEWHERYDEKTSEQLEKCQKINCIPPVTGEEQLEAVTEADLENLPSEQDKRGNERLMKIKTIGRKEQIDQVEKNRRRQVQEFLKTKSQEASSLHEEVTQSVASSRKLDSSKYVREVPATPSEPEDDDDDDDIVEEQPYREIQWLQEHGSCLDNLKAGKSTILEFGRGAFATRLLPRNSIISSAPLLALKRADLVMYEENKESTKFLTTLNFDKIVGQEQILNYCYGHPESDLLLVPYAPVVNFINHADDPAKVNAEIRWPSDKRAQDLLNRLPKDWLDAHPLDVTDQSGQLLFDFVATRDIKPGEEIFINYGDNWKAAWKEHITSTTGQQKPSGEMGFAQGFRHEIGVPDGFFPANWLNQLMEYEVERIEHLEPGEIRPLTWKHNGQPVAKTAFAIGIPQNLTKQVHNFANERGIISVYEQVLTNEVLGSDQWYVFDADQHEGPPEQWFVHRYMNVAWDFNMHYLAAWDETARKNVYRMLGKYGFDPVLDGLGTYFGLDTLTCFHTSFIGVSEADNSFMHTDTYSTGDVGYNLIFPIISVDGSKPELDIQSDNADIVVAVKYEHDRAFLLSDNGYHRTSAVQYDDKSQIRVVLGLYCAQIDETNNVVMKHLYDGEDPAPFMDQFELPIQEIHWSKTGIRLPR